MISLSTIHSFVATAIVLVTLIPSAALGSQARDHLTEKEQELVRDTQVLDKRIDVFIKAIDRRLMVLKGNTVSDKQSKKDAEVWGDAPVGSPAQLIGDIARIIDEAITNIDDVNSRDEKNPLIPKALRKLATASARIVEELRPLQSQTESAATSGFDLIVQHAEELTDAANRLPPPAEKKSKDKNKTEKAKTMNPGPLASVSR